jgi:phage terminase large subunit-like protein
MSDVNTNVVPIKRGAKQKPLIGALKPRIHTPLVKGVSKSQDVIDLAQKIGMPLMPWQKWVLEDMLKIDKDGNWQKRSAVLCVARQSGKTHLARMLILTHLFIWQSKSIIGISSNRNMALQTFRDVAYIIEDHPFLKNQVRSIRYANGQESITTENGCRYEILAATRDGTRGKTANFLFVDELREISEEAWQAATPITRATSGQIFACSNAGDYFSTVLNTIRENALSYPAKSLGYYEYSAPQHCKINDKKAWAMANPALGYTITEETLAEAVATNSIEATRTEMLCQWIDSLQSPWVHGSIEACSQSDLVLPVGSQTVLAFDVAPTKRSGALVAAQVLPDGKIGAGLMQLWSSEVAIDEIKMASDINDWAMKYRPMKILYDKYATQSIAQRLEQSGHKVEDCSGQSFYQACSDLGDSLANLRLVHSGQPDLVAHLNNCAAKTNDAGWRIIRRKSAGDVTAAISLAMVVHELGKPQRVANIII